MVPQVKALAVQAWWRRKAGTDSRKLYSDFWPSHNSAVAHVYMCTYIIHFKIIFKRFSLVVTANKIPDKKQMGVGGEPAWREGVGTWTAMSQAISRKQKAGCQCSAGVFLFPFHSVQKSSPRTMLPMCRVELPALARLPVTALQSHSKCLMNALGVCESNQTDN